MGSFGKWANIVFDWLFFFSFLSIFIPSDRQVFKWVFVGRNSYPTINGRSERGQQMFGNIRGVSCLAWGSIGRR